MKNIDILNKINSPEDLKKLDIEELKKLSNEIRNTLIERVSVTGGHMGSNLGFVEATIAMHYVFNSPKDKFVFDVSHQSYTHKILTGRKEGFTVPEKYYSLSGYTTPTESEHDFFKIGHTSTSISLAIGLAKGRDLKGENENIIAVIGDGSMSGGEALEGLNNAAMLNSNMIIIFNDNEMSIAENQGGMYENFKLLRETNGKSDNNFFKSFGLDYKYVEEGNDIEKLVEVFEEVKDIDHPIVIHVHTLKGNGLNWAIEDKESGHWAIAKALSNIKPTENYNEITNNFILEKIKNDKKVVAVTAGTPGVTGMTKEFRKLAGKQFVDVGIAEEHAVAFISGLAKNGAKPVFEVMSSFIQRTYDQLNHDLAMNSNPATILVYGAGIGGGDCTHNGMYDVSMLSSIPNLVCLAPTTKEQYLAMLDWSIEQNNHPVVIRVPDEVISVGVEEEFDENMIYKMKIRKYGSKIAILALGNAYKLGEEVVNLIEEKSGINATLIDPVNYANIDKEGLEALEENHSIVVTIENGVLDGGFGQKVASYFAKDNTMKVISFGGEKSFNDLLAADEIAKKNHMTKEQIVEDIFLAL